MNMRSIALYTVFIETGDNKMYKIKVVRSDKAFNDKECTCYCNNKHELYGGKGYTMLPIASDHKVYRNKVQCNVCNAIHIRIEE